MNQILEICQGLPGCGKTSYAKNKCKKDNTFVRVNRDDLREMRTPYWLPKQEDLITDWERYAVIAALTRGFNVILDATNLNPKYLEQWKQDIADFNERCDREVTIQYRLFPEVSVDECVRRDAARGARGERSVGEQVIRDMAKKYLTCDSKYDSIIQNPNLKHAIIVDIDGTVAICGDRSHYDYSKVQFDSLHEPVADIVKRYMGWTTILYVSGREDSCYEQTREWLHKHGLYYGKGTANEPDNGTFLYMRKAGDHRKDCIVKKEIFDAHIRDKYFIKFCIDDRTQVVQLWRSLGLICLQVADGNF